MDTQLVVQETEHERIARQQLERYRAELHQVEQQLERARQMLKDAAAVTSCDEAFVDLRQFIDARMVEREITHVKRSLDDRAMELRRDVARRAEVIAERAAEAERRVRRIAAIDAELTSLEENIPKLLAAGEIVSDERDRVIALGRERNLLV